MSAVEPGRRPNSNGFAAVGVVILTQGTRAEGLRGALDSVLSQRDVDVDVVVVGNGWDPASADPALPPSVSTRYLPENQGIPAGRNSGVSAVSGEFLLFLDDDAALADPRFLATACGKLRSDSTLGLLQPQVRDPVRADAPRRWIPRIRKGKPERSGVVFSCWEGAIVMPRAVFAAIGGWGEPYFYAHEGIELVWRVWDHGYRAWYAGDLLAHHPVVVQSRHDQYFRLTARNRVWVARRNLPAPLVPVYVLSWTAIQSARWLRDRRGFRAWWRGWREGWRVNPGGRHPIRWRTVWRMTRAGRPPVV